MPMAAPGAMGIREKNGFSGAKTSKSLKKSRAARAKSAHLPAKITIWAVGPQKAKTLPKWRILNIRLCEPRLDQDPRILPRPRLIEQGAKAKPDAPAGEQSFGFLGERAGGGAQLKREADAPALCG